MHCNWHDLGSPLTSPVPLFKSTSDKVLHQGQLMIWSNFSSHSDKLLVISCTKSYSRTLPTSSLHILIGFILMLFTLNALKRRREIWYDGTELVCQCQTPASSLTGRWITVTSFLQADMTDFSIVLVNAFPLWSNSPRSLFFWRAIKLFKLFSHRWDLQEKKKKKKVCESGASWLMLLMWQCPWTFNVIDSPAQSFVGASCVKCWW